MPDVMPEDVLLLVGATRHGVPVVRGSRRARELLMPAYGMTRADGSTPIATYVDRGGGVRTAAQNLLRVEWADLDGDGIRETPGLLLEGNRLNSCLQSETFQTTWGPANVSVSADATAAPDEKTTADKLVESAAASVEHFVEQTISGATASTTQPPCVFAKPAGRDWIRVSIVQKDNVSVLGAFFNVATGAIGTVSGGATAFTPEKVANGFYRCGVAVGSGTGANQIRMRVKVASADNQNTYTGDGTSGVYVWGGQLELDKPFPSSYIKTTTAAVGRAPDNLIVPFSFGQVPMTVYARFQERGSATSDTGAGPAQFGAGTTPFCRWDAFGTSGTRYRWSNQQVAGVTVSTPSGNPAIGQVIEELGQLNADGSVRAFRSITGGAATDGGLSGAQALTALWSAQSLLVGPSLWHGLLFKLAVFRGVFSLAEVRAAFPS